VGKIRFFKSEEVPFVEADGGAGASRQHQPGGKDELHLFEVRLPPHRKVDLHAHQEDEIIHVVAGQISVGNRVLGPGDSVFIAGMTLYGFEAGPEGVRYLNFRKRRDLTNYTSEQFHEYRTLDPSAQAAMNERLFANRRIPGWDE
jgi:quercetin dioxygenase-like cupin family protein